MKVTNFGLYFSDMFDYHLKKLMEAGILNQEQKRWQLINKENKCTTEGSSAEASPLEYNNVISPFLIVICGAGLSVFLVFGKQRKNISLLIDFQKFSLIGEFFVHKLTYCQSLHN